jgi:hypothetical protein
MKAWLVTWEWANDAAAVADRVICVLPPQWSDERVSNTVEILYASLTATVSELAHYAKRPSNNPYRAERSGSRIICGHNPYLEARYVSDLKVETDPKTYIETIFWREPNLYRFENGKRVLVAEGNQEKFTRKVSGSPIHEGIWDCSTGTFRPGWEPTAK